MIYAPLIFFSIIFVLIFRKRGLDASSYISLLYIITSTFAVICYNANMFDESHKNISVLAGTIYCVLIGLCIMPVYLINTNKISTIKLPNQIIINILTIYFFINVLFCLIVYWKDLLFILSFDDWAALRSMVRSGEGIVSANPSGILRFFILFFGVTGSVSFIMFPIFFISLCFLKKSWWFNLMAIIGTTNVIIQGVLGCDRSSTFRWLLLLGLNLVLFWKNLNTKTRVRIIPILSILIICSVLYIGSVTYSRFETNTNTAKEGFYSYAGLPYVNFCYLFDRYDNHEGFNTHYFFPATHKWIIGDYDNNVGLQEEMTMKSGLPCGTFYSVLGSFLIDCNQSGPFVFVLVYLLLFSMAKKESKTGIISFEGFIQRYLLMIIPAYGIIAYAYTSAYSTISIFMLLLLLRLSSQSSKNNYKNSLESYKT